MANPRQPLTVAIPDYDTRPADYLTTDPTTGAGLMEIQGRRPNQEDQLLVTPLRGFETLSPSGQDTALTYTFADMQARFGNNEAGSTACVATAWLDENNRLHAKSAHVGDSEAYIVVTHENGNTLLVRLNKNLHSAKNTAEANRIREEGGFVVMGRVGGVLAVTRAIGDQEILTRVSDHIPDVDSLELALQLQPGQRAFMIVACDGLFENLKTIEDKSLFLSLSVNASPAEPQNIARDLVQAAYQRSRDNISVAVVPITQCFPVSAAVFDGHGGESVSRNLAANFYDKLRECMQQLGANLNAPTVTVAAPAAIAAVAVPAHPATPPEPRSDETLGDDDHGYSSSSSSAGGGGSYNNDNEAPKETTKKDILDDLYSFLCTSNLSKEAILDKFLELKKRDGDYSAIHQQRHPTFDRFRLFFKSNVNQGESNFWHTASYQAAVKMLKQNYLTKTGKISPDRAADEAAFIDYVRGNSPIHSSKTTTRMDKIARDNQRPRF